MEPEGLRHTCECVSVWTCMYMHECLRMQMCVLIGIRVYNYVVHSSECVCVCVCVCASVWGHECLGICLCVHVQYEL